MLNAVTRRLANRVARWRYQPNIEIQSSPQLIRLGTDYGGWLLEPSPDLQHATIISCGLGEDASFDVEFAQRFEASVILVDPTPRAIQHYEQIAAQFGQRAAKPYVKGGQQPIASYDLEGLDASRLRLEPFAIWNESTRLRFYSPPEASHVSHSIVNIQNNYSSETEYIEVEARPVDFLLKHNNLQSVPLIKLDVEGAEAEVIPSILDAGVHPRQFLIEFDEINFPSPRAKQRVERTDEALHAAGYVCHYRDRANFLYILD